MQQRFLSLAAAVGISNAATCVAADAEEITSYVPVQLVLPSSYVFYDARRISDSGVAGGYIRISNSVAPFDLPILWSHLGDFEALTVPGDFRNAGVLGFSPAGAAVGFARFPNTVGPSPVIWNEGAYSNLPDFGSGGAVMAANSHLLVGETGDPNQPGYIHRVSVWNADGTNPRVVSGLPQNIASRVSGMGALGTYVGNTRVLSGPSTGQVNGFIGRDGTAEFTSYPGFNAARPTDINDDDWMVGIYDLDGSFNNRAFIAKAFDDEIHDLGLFPGFVGIQPQAINNAGVIVGAAINNTFERALIWPAGSFTPIDLNTLVDIPGETLVEAMDINNAGQILARGFNGYYIFTPIPEPAMLTAISIAAVLLSRVRRD